MKFMLCINKQIIKALQFLSITLPIYVLFYKLAYNKLYRYFNTEKQDLFLFWPKMYYLSHEECHNEPLFQVICRDRLTLIFIILFA